MRYSYKTRNMHLDPGLIDYCKEKMTKFKKLVSDNAFLEIEFIDEFGERGGFDKRVSANLDIPGQKLIHIENSAKDWFSAIDFAQDRILKEIIQLKEKNRDNKRRI